VPLSVRSSRVTIQDMECFALRRSHSCNISRRLMLQYKGTKKSVPEIASELRVDGVMEGSVQRVDDRARTSVQLNRSGA
jgi:TolB-like protein